MFKSNSTRESLKKLKWHHAMVRIVGVTFLLLLSFQIFAVTSNSVSIVPTPGTGYFALVESGIAANLIVDPKDAEVVTIAATAFSDDIKLVTGIKPTVTNSLITGNNPVIIGTLGKSALIDTLAAHGKILADSVRGKWETFCISVVQNPLNGVDNAVVIFGSDPRGTAFGVFELSRIMGVSPWIWWADVTPVSRPALYATPGQSIFGPPSVKFRGIFLNDEDWGLRPWAATKLDKNVQNIGPRTYEKIFELMLRLKANYIWPAMHEGTKAFWYYPENPQLARRYSIVLGSSHAEPMLRNNVDEWINNLAYPYANWNWATKSTLVADYWRTRAGESRNNDAVYTVGMRGIHDSAMPGYSDLNSKVNALKEVISVQRLILKDSLKRDPAIVPQIFCPYKETLELYNLGLNLADDITLAWADDNHGYIRQLSNQTEQLRKGGAGVYYHLSYWGAPEDYLWLSSISPAQISYEMSKAFALNTKNLWVFNVGDIKPAEMELQFAMDMAWNTSRWTPDKAYLYAKEWAKETFGAQYADEIFNIKQEYYRLAAAGKPEHISIVTYTSQEMDKRLSDYSSLVALSKQVEATIPTRLKDAYFELIGYPVEAAANMNQKIFYAKKSLKLASEGNNDALTYSNLANTAFYNLVSLTNKYNTQIANGKWNGMMSYNPRGRSQFNAPTVATSTSVNKNGIPSIVEDSIIIIPAQNFVAQSGAGYTIKTLSGLGENGCSVAVWPLNTTTYSATNITSAPYVEYNVPVVKGVNKIRVKCLPNFPLYGGMQLRVALSIAGATPVFSNIATTAEATTWSKNVLCGYASSDNIYTSDTDKFIKIRVYFSDPGLVLSSITVLKTAPESPYTSWMKNPDFEYSAAGVLNTGFPTRGLPYGWKQTGTVAGNSYGLHNDATNFNGNTMCWYNVNSSPYVMPAKFELYQTVKGLPAGKYIVRCRLAAMSGYITNVRLFANKNVQYYAASPNYVSNLTTGEINSFASNTPVSGMTKAFLSEMAVVVILNAGDSLNLGIRSSNLLSDGTSATSTSSSNVPGGFKVDYFRLEKVSDMQSTEIENINNPGVQVFTVQDKICIKTNHDYNIGKVQVFSVLGFKLYETKIEGDMNYINHPLTDIFIVRIELDNEVISQKIISKQN
ncbi:MAG: glycosyl hydrolase 115 family protein [Paludibacter sp.]|nr:glycosyl hydrolase 115 family protein [Paludibacter sp.]